MSFCTLPCYKMYVLFYFSFFLCNNEKECLSFSKNLLYLFCQESIKAIWVEDNTFLYFCGQQFCCKQKIIILQFFVCKFTIRDMCFNFFFSKMSHVLLHLSKIRELENSIWHQIWGCTEWMKYIFIVVKDISLLI